MVSMRAYFDGYAVIPKEPLDLPRGSEVIVHVESPDVGSNANGESALDWILANPIEQDDVPHDLAEQHDHYLYGTPKKGKEGRIAG